MEYLSFIVYNVLKSQTPLCLFVRKLIEGEDSRLSSMVQNLSVIGGLHHAVGVSTVSDSGTSGPTEQDKQSMDSKMSDSEEQGTKTSERKTVLIR